MNHSAHHHDCCHMQINVSFNFQNATDLSWEMNLISVSDDHTGLAEEMTFVGIEQD